MGWSYQDVMDLPAELYNEVVTWINEEKPKRGLF